MKLFRITYRAYLPSGKFVGLHQRIVEAYDVHHVKLLTGFVEAIIVNIEEL